MIVAKSCNGNGDGRNIVLTGNEMVYPAPAHHLSSNESIDTGSFHIGRRVYENKAI